MKKILFILSITIILIALTSGCNWFKPKQVQVIPTETKLTFLVSAEDALKFCNGADMDSEGFKKTITKEWTATSHKTNLSRNQLIKETLIYAAQEADFSIANNVDEEYIKIIGDTAYIQPIEGWAGVSIFLCYWKPFMEVNLLLFPEIKNVVWANSAEEWDKLVE